jgi:hypothetical protein
MDANRFDAVAKLFATRRLSRRRALARGGAGLAAGALAATGLSAAMAQDATPSAEPVSDRGPTMLFIQSFRQGSIAPKVGEDGIYTLKLEQGLGQTIYFSDRPDRIVGATPTDQFLAGLGFAPDNPPNAALIFEAEPGHTDIAVLELFNPVFDPAGPGVTYDVQVLQEWARTLEMGFSKVPTDLDQMHPAFGAAHLFIDSGLDCPDATMHCVTDLEHPGSSKVGSIPNEDHDGYCAVGGFGNCMPCQPWLGNQWTKTRDYWDTQCNKRFPACNGKCWATNICTRGSADICRPN